MQSVTPQCGVYRGIAMVDKKHLQGKQVIIKINGLSRILHGTVTHVDDDGFWISGDAIIAEIADAGGLTIALNTPAVFVPTVQLLWLIASNE
jgi:hypothetical protein